MNKVKANTRGKSVKNVVSTEPLCVEPSREMIAMRQQVKELHEHLEGITTLGIFTAIGKATQPLAAGIREMSVALSKMADELAGATQITETLVEATTTRVGALIQRIEELAAGVRANTEAMLTLTTAPKLPAAHAYDKHQRCTAERDIGENVFKRCTRAADHTGNHYDDVNVQW